MALGKTLEEKVQAFHTRYDATIDSVAEALQEELIQTSEHRVDYTRNPEAPMDSIPAWKELLALKKAITAQPAALLDETLFSAKSRPYNTGRKTHNPYASELSDDDFLEIEPPVDSSPEELQEAYMRTARESVSKQADNMLRYFEGIAAQLANDEKIPASTALLQMIKEWRQGFDVGDRNKEDNKKKKDDKLSLGNLLADINQVKMQVPNFKSDSDAAIDAISDEDDHHEEHRKNHHSHHAPGSAIGNAKHASRPRTVKLYSHGDGVFSEDEPGSTSRTF